MAWKDLQLCSMKALAAAAKWFAALVILLDAIQGSPSRCAKGQYKDPDSGDCMRCPYCPQKYWQSPDYYQEECAHNNMEAVMIQGFPYRSWCRPKTPESYYDVCEFPKEVQGQVNCTNGPRYGKQCNLTCDNGQVSSFTCLPNSAQNVAELCQTRDSSTSAGLPPSTSTNDSAFYPPSTTTAPPGVEGAGGFPPTVAIAVSASLAGFVLLMVVIIVWKCCWQGRKAEGSNENLTVKIGSDGSSTSSADSEPSPSDSLLDGSKEEEKKKAEKDASCHIVEMKSPGASTGMLRDPGCYEEPESLPPPYSFIQVPYGACEIDHLQGQLAVDTPPDDSVTVPKVRVDPSSPPVWEPTPRSHRLQVVSGLQGTGPGNKAVMMSMQSPSPCCSFPSLSEDMEMTEPEPALDPEDCSHPVSLLFSSPPLRQVLTELKLELEPVDRKDPSLTMVGLSMHCLKWPHNKADNLRWARRENLQESPAHVTLLHMREEGLKLGHIALYFSQQSHRNREIVKLLKSADTHQQCLFCSRL